MSRSRLTLLVLGLLLLGLAGAAFLLRGLPPPVPVASVDLASPAALSPDDRRFYQLVAPVLRAAAGEARALTSQGRERSRNIFAIRAGQDRLEGHLRSLDALFAESMIPTRYAPVGAAYRPAAVDIRAAMGQAAAAFARLDWVGVAAATERMAMGTSQLDAAVTKLNAAVGATPVAPATP